MTEPSLEQVFRWVEEARDLPQAERRAFLVRAAAGYPELFAMALELLETDVPSGFAEPRPRQASAGLGQDLSGSRLGEYLLGLELGRGGMGVVYLAQHPSGAGELAIKVLPSLKRMDPAAAERFRRESIIARELDHPNLLRILAQGTSGDVDWHAMPLVRGHDLHQEMMLQRAHRRGEGAMGSMILPPFGSPAYLTAAMKLVAALARGLDHAHQRSVLHRDVKPRNILLERSRDGAAPTPILADFGLARFEGLGSITGSRDVQGTPHYMSPEQARALALPVDQRSDQYSLGVVLYELLSLSLPHGGGSSQEILRRIAKGSATRLGRANPELPKDVVVVCEQAISRRPEARYPDCAALAGDLERLLDQRAILARPPSALRRALDWARMRPSLVMAVFTGLLALALGVWVARWSGRQAQLEGLKLEIDQALALPDWDLGDEAQMPLLASACRALRRAKAEGVGGGLGSSFQEMEQRLEDARSRWVADLQGRLRDAQGGFEDPERFAGFLAPARPLAVAAVRRVAERAAELLPEDGELAQLADEEHAFPQVELDWVDAQDQLAIGGRRVRAWARRRDPIADVFEAPIEIEPPPSTVVLAPGPWRLIVRVEGLGAAEVERDLEYSVNPLRVPVRVVPEEFLHQGMVRIAESEAIYGEGIEEGCSLSTEPYTVESFWLDEAVVSNAEYLAYMEASGAPVPYLWERLGYSGDRRSLPGVDCDLRWFDQPAVGMSLHDMRAFAEWNGKRLPTHHELELALRGPAMAREFQGAGPANVDGPNIGGAGSHPEKYAMYVRNTLDVRAEGYRQPPYGLYHIYGNVAEWTSSPFVESHEGRLYVHAYDHVRISTEWDARTVGMDLTAHAVYGIGDNYVTANTGFRCAASAFD